MPEPYIVNPHTGESVTKEFIRRFILRYDSIAEQLDGGLKPQEAPTYQNKSKDSTKAYIGRAAKVQDGKNPHEDLWCIRMDIANAANKLTETQRVALGYRATGHTNKEAGFLMSLSEREVARIVDAALEKLTRILDGTECASQKN